VLDAWARILLAVPDSRLILKWRTFADASFRQRVTDAFAIQGIAAERIELRPMSVHRQLLEEYADTDIALDPFPFSGGHTSCEALWLGVPVVSCTGKDGGDFAPRFASRMGYAFLNNIDFPELAAETVAEYVEIAVALAKDPQRMTMLRQTLRSRMASAPLTDEARFVSEMEEAYRAMWRDWGRINI